MRPARSEPPLARAPSTLARGRLARLAPFAAAAVALLLVASALVPRGKVNGFDLEAFGRLPVLQGGRVKPLDTVARNALLMIRSQQEFRAEAPGTGKKETLSATRWLLDVMFRPQLADKQPAFVINDPELLGLMGLPQTANRYYPFESISPHADQVQKQAMAAQAVESANRTRFQRAAVNLAERAWLYFKLKNTVEPEGTPLSAEIAAAGTAPGAEHQRGLQQLAEFRPLPPTAGARADAWRSTGTALAAVGAGQSDPQLVGWARLGKAWADQDAPAFNQAVADLWTFESAAAPAAARQGVREQVFNRASPFILGIELYVLALLVVFLSWLFKPEVLGPTSFVLLCAGALVHTAGLVSRIVLQGRPPVTNLYSSAVFVGFVAVVLGVILERMYRRGFGTLVAGAIGVGTLIIAHNLSGDGDTMEMMRAVLDSNFWLSTHVLTITIGYGGTFLAGVLAIAWVVRRHLLPGRNLADDKVLASSTYGVVCFSLLFSFVGTVLGGIWADQSWGRFWGWDPKENGALLIVLWNAIILHARWGGYARERGIMAMAIFGNVITSLSWFGVNMLGVGLHSYGFMDKAFWALFTFIASQLVLVALALARPRFWKAEAWARSDGSPRPA
ncbi:MAG TPA: cytochrome c biogenesis protein CcsA [Anaeromyxobacter sp.]|nr:cytochrome c biogenesis protein CcsA [Anaeromyxobacter sp.]